MLRIADANILKIAGATYGSKRHSKRLKCKMPHKELIQLEKIRVTAAKQNFFKENIHNHCRGFQTLAIFCFSLMPRCRKWWNNTLASLHEKKYKENVRLHPSIKNYKTQVKAFFLDIVFGRKNKGYWEVCRVMTAPAAEHVGTHKRSELFPHTRQYTYP